MATALQQQLAVIAANSTHQLDLKAQKARHSKSLIHEPREASTQSFEALYQTCLEGFEELCQLDARFAPFGRSLFSEQSKNEDRAQMTAKENEELDAVVERFLGLLGGRLLLRPAEKAAEWLVRRFRVQEHNTEAVLLAFLPYHSSPIFQRLLAIIPSQLPPTFRFLHPYVASLQCPPRHAVVAAVSSNAALFTAYSHKILNVAKAKHHSALVLGFWASITAQGVDGMVNATRSGRQAVQRQREEDLLLRILPVLQSALSIKAVPELYLASCMIIAILATKATLQDHVLGAMMEAVAGTWTEQTIVEGMSCLAVLAEEQQQLSLPKTVVRAIMHQDDVPGQLRRIAETCRVGRLVTGLALGVVKSMARESDDRSVQMLRSCLDSELCTEQQVGVIIEAALKSAGQSEGWDSGAIELLSAVRGFATKDHLEIVTQAARRLQLDLAALDSQLALQIQSHAPTTEEAEDQDQVVVKKEEPTTGTQPQLGAMSKLPGEEVSFLDRQQSQRFDDYALSFPQYILSDKNISSFKSKSTQDGAYTRKSAFFTFLARVWSSEAPTATRSKALDIAREQIQQLAKKRDSSADLQVLIPYGIAALGNPAKPLRSAAASFLLALENLYCSMTREGSSLDDVKIWSQTSVYGTESSKVHWLETRDAHFLLTSAVVPMLEDCLVDADHAVRSLAEALDASQSVSKPVHKALKTSLRTSASEFFASHIVASPVLSVQLKLLEIISKLGKVGASARAAILLPHIREQFAGNAEDRMLRNALVHALTHRSSDELQLLKQIAALELGSSPADSKTAFARLRRVWRSMKLPSQSETADWLLELALNDAASELVQSESRETLRDVQLPTELMVHMCESLPGVNDMQDQPRSSKKQRNSRTSETPKPGSVEKEKLNAAIRRITLVLELIEESEPGKHPQLLKNLFHLLSDLHHYKVLLDSELVYIQALLVSNLLSVVDGLKATEDKSIDRSVIRPDLIVECVRTTSSTQVHHAALLLMSSLASWAPDLVLHSVMPLFTFMSSTILKQGDDYSAHVTEQTVARIIPPLAVSLKKRGKDLISGAAELLLSFTAAFEHIPLHRRASLYQHLVQTLGADESLFAVAAMLVERYPDDPSVLPFVSDLMAKFSVLTQLQAVGQYLALVADTTKPKRKLADVILGFGEKNQDQAAEATSVLLDGLAHILARETLRKKLLKGLKEGTDEANQIRSTYASLLQTTMDLALQLSTKEADMHSGADDVLTALLGVMPTPDFIDSSAQLMQTGSDEMRRQVFASLEHRVSAARAGDAQMQMVFMDVLPNCSVFLSEVQPTPTRRAAISCIDRIAEKFGKTNRSAVLQAAQQITGLAALGSDVSSLRATALLCLASMVEVLGDEFIPVLPKALDQALKILSQVMEGKFSEPTLHRAAFRFAISVLDYVPWMLSGKYLDKMLVFAAQSAAPGNAVVDAAIAHQFCTLAAKQLSAQEALGAIERTWDQTLIFGFYASRQHVQMLQAVIEKHPKSTIKKNAQLLFTVMLRAFDLRGSLPRSNDWETAPLPLFSLVDQVAMDMVRKLDDSTFRPFFLRLTEWATAGSTKANVAKKLPRCTSLYSFMLTLSEAFKSLVTTYYSYVLENTAFLLQHLPSIANLGSDAQCLLDTLLQALQSSFRHDQDSFWQSPAHFDAVMEPLVNLLKQAKVLAVDENVIPAITELAMAASSSSHYKTLNTLLMSYMRHEYAAVRLAAVKCERSITSKLGLEWLDLLPEMLPFLHELQEDDDAAVEREVLRWNAQIEQVTGESLQNMLQ